MAGTRTDPEGPAADPGPGGPPPPAPGPEPGSTAPPGAAHRPMTRTVRFAWGAVTVLFVGVIALIVYSVTDPPVTLRVVHRAETAPSVVASLSDVGQATFDAVGVDAGSTSLALPTVLRGQPLLTSAGKPEVLYVGSEYCPFCGAERWPLIVALSRFGAFSHLHDMQSSSTSVFPSLQTFTFVGATYRSPYVSFVGIELYSDVHRADGAFTRIATLTPGQQGLVGRYGSGAGAAPFVDVGNRLVSSTSAFSPAVLGTLSQATIADRLDEATRPSTQAIVAAANLLSAGICAATGQQPAAVCSSRGVVAGDRLLGLP